MPYRMIAVDIDGTLLDSRGRLSPANRDAIAAAQEAGVLVTPCTGRAWIEARQALAGLEKTQMGVFVGGAAVSDIATGQTLDLALIEPHLALDLVRFLYDLPDAVLVFRDANLVGHDYLVTGTGSLTANTRWWFEATGARVHFQRHVGLEDMHHALRVGLVTRADRMRRITGELERAFPGRIVMQSFAAVQMPDPDETVHVLEVFAQGVDKWRGLEWLARRQGIQAQEVAAIGDEINDVAMIRGAGCGIAMGNAIQAVKAVADYETLDRDHDGVAYAIGRLLAGEWD